MSVDSRNDVRDFLASRRARITPLQAGLVAYGRNRRVPGMRREEVAMLAGVSIDYYTQLELNFEAMDLSADPGLTFTAYSAEPGTPAHDTLRLLASWAATMDQDAARVPGTL